MPGPSLLATELRLAFGVQAVVDMPVLEAVPGSLTALVGASGSGKSSLLYLLSGLLRPTGGTIAWGRNDLARLSERQRDAWRRRHAGFVFQDFHLIPEMSPLDNVLVPVWFANASAAAHRARAETLLEQLDVPYRRASVAELSRGQQQRVAIARALIGDPAVVFADEPTASLDAQAARTVADILLNLATVEGRTVIVATHDPALRSRATAVLALEHGRPLLQAAA